MFRITFFTLIILSFLIGCSAKKSPAHTIANEIEALGGFVGKDENENVFYINLSSCDVNQSLIEQLPIFDNLQYLILEYTEIENKDLEYIGKIDSLEVLNINQTKTTDEGLLNLLPLNNLKELKMSHYSLTRPIPEELKGVSMDDMLSGKVRVETERDYGEGITALLTKFPKLKTTLWGALPG